MTPHAERVVRQRCARPARATHTAFAADMAPCACDSRCFACPCARDQPPHALILSTPSSVLLCVRMATCTAALRARPNRHASAATGDF
eukprot:CAMPEP_0181171676 /NCGR_PEP_ID=MMETSP1096-20121128/2041_1 /TAXON_ID=156174 ORGANISM="Chrysochromulina ericina, Strain CCMP281" /NCGR_SAMPLE_ID=MMETSP1096 /ASSEMBLY_ACC=CAM_ASM_000453 /LENGTH=87 /DNA_ID=CAMNT_0023259349 /DNA_START=255 /DNA_END=518 /DNA_ORIENTATION=-